MLSVRPSPLFKSRKTKQQKTMLATGVTMGLGEWIIGDTCLVKSTNFASCIFDQIYVILRKKYYNRYLLKRYKRLSFKTNICSHYQNESFLYRELFKFNFYSYTNALWTMMIWFTSYWRHTFCPNVQSLFPVLFKAEGLMLIREP